MSSCKDAFGRFASCGGPRGLRGINTNVPKMAAEVKGAAEAVARLHNVYGPLGHSHWTGGSRDAPGRQTSHVDPHLKAVADNLRKAFEAMRAAEHHAFMYQLETDNL